MSGRLRCAIYTRKSTEEGLEQNFNSLHAQREACEAYVLSQAGEGWTALREEYDDGGFSGGSMERPGLRQLLADIDAGKIDIVVVYKVDRITRSLSDFARIVEVFDRRKVSFVAVTQAFNTTTSMGRLTLNVLLSFAQFEREVTGERIRDKIAASKAKGMWMGGLPPLGYDARDRRLIINTDEAEQVRHIYRRYLELGSARLVAGELAADGVKSKRWITRRGKETGGAVLTRGAVFHILQNAIYRGKVVHKGTQHKGQHEAIVDDVMFDEVAQKLKSQATVWRNLPTKAQPGPLAGKLYDAAGAPMSPSFSYGRGGRLYRYYVALALQTGGQPGKGVIPRVSAKLVENFLTDEVSRLTCRSDVTTPLLISLVDRVELGGSETHLVLWRAKAFPHQHPELVLKGLKARLSTAEEAVTEDADRIRVVLQRRLQLRGGRTFFTGGREPPAHHNGLKQALRRAHSDLLALNASPMSTPSDILTAAAPATMHDREIARLAFLCPEIQARLLDGDHSPTLKLRHLLRSHIPLAWDDQKAWFEGLAPSAG